MADLRLAVERLQQLMPSWHAHPLIGIHICINHVEAQYGKQNERSQGVTARAPEVADARSELRRGARSMGCMAGFPCQLAMADHDVLQTPVGKRMLMAAVCVGGWSKTIRSLRPDEHPDQLSRAI